MEHHHLLSSVSIQSPPFAALTPPKVSPHKNTTTMPSFPLRVNPFPDQKTPLSYSIVAPLLLIQTTLHDPPQAGSWVGLFTYPFPRHWQRIFWGNFFVSPPPMQYGTPIGLNTITTRFHVTPLHTPFPYDSFSRMITSSPPPPESVPPSSTEHGLFHRFRRHAELHSFLLDWNRLTFSLFLQNFCRSPTTYPPPSSFPSQVSKIPLFRKRSLAPSGLPPSAPSPRGRPSPSGNCTRFFLPLSSYDEVGNLPPPSPPLSSLKAQTSDAGGLLNLHFPVG